MYLFKFFFRFHSLGEDLEFTNAWFPSPRACDLIGLGFVLGIYNGIYIFLKMAPCPGDSKAQPGLEKPCLGGTEGSRHGWHLVIGAKSREEVNKGGWIVRALKDAIRSLTLGSQLFLFLR